MNNFFEVFLFMNVLYVILFCDFVDVMFECVVGFIDLLFGFKEKICICNVIYMVCFGV